MSSTKTVAPRPGDGIVDSLTLEAGLSLWERGYNPSDRCAVLSLAGLLEALVLHPRLLYDPKTHFRVLHSVPLAKMVKAMPIARFNAPDEVLTAVQRQVADFLMPVVSYWGRALDNLCKDLVGVGYDQFTSLDSEGWWHEVGCGTECYFAHNLVVCQVCRAQYYSSVAAHFALSYMPNPLRAPVVLNSPKVFRQAVLHQARKTAAQVRQDVRVFHEHRARADKPIAPIGALIMAEADSADDICRLVEMLRSNENVQSFWSWTERAHRHLQNGRDDLVAKSMVEAMSLLSNALDTYRVPTPMRDRDSVSKATMVLSAGGPGLAFPLPHVRWPKLYLGVHP